jgi:CDP-diacylglycerol--glycerol-3-phosphate 3-phosphatidyltransferase/cardiolipin synthase
MDSISKKFILAGITFIRIILAPLFFFTIINDLYVYSIGIFILAGASDMIDGLYARSYGLNSPKGAYYDISSDFIFILAGFSAFVVNGIYPYWVLIIIVVMFLQFLATSTSRTQIYDPVGKYYGSFLYLVIIISLIIINPLLYSMLTILIIIFTLTSLMSRLIFMKKKEFKK